MVNKTADFVSLNLNDLNLECITDNNVTLNIEDNVNLIKTNNHSHICFQLNNIRSAYYSLTNISNNLYATIDNFLFNLKQTRNEKSKKITKQKLMEAQKKYLKEAEQKFDVNKLMQAQSYALKAEQHQMFSKDWIKYNLLAYKTFCNCAGFKLSNDLIKLYSSYAASGAFWGLNTLLRTPTFGINNKYAAVGLQISNLLITPGHIGSTLDILFGSAGDLFIVKNKPVLHSSITKEDSYKQIKYEAQQTYDIVNKINFEDIETAPKHQAAENKIIFNSLIEKQNRQNAHTHYFMFGSGGVARSIMGTLFIIGLSVFISQIHSLTWENAVIILMYSTIIICSSAIDRNIQHLMMTIYNLQRSTLIPENMTIESIKQDDIICNKLQKDLSSIFIKQEQIKYNQVKTNAEHKISNLVRKKDILDNNNDKYKKVSQDLDTILHEFLLFKQLDWGNLDPNNSIAKDITNFTHRFISNIKTNLQTNHTLDAQIIKNYTNSFYSLILAPAILSIIGDVLRYKLADKELGLKLYIMCKNMSRIVLLTANMLSSTERIKTKDIIRNPNDEKNARKIRVSDDETGQIINKPIDRNGKIITTSIKIGNEEINTLITDKQYDRLHQQRFVPNARKIQSVFFGVFPHTIINKLTAQKQLNQISPLLKAS